jgi:hypothetical protein
VKILKSVWAGTVSGVCLALLIAACTPNPVKEAETFEQKAYALYGTYVIFQGKAAELVQDAAVSDRIKMALREADRVSYPVAEGLVDAAGEVSAIKDLLEQCGEAIESDPICVPTNERRLANAITNLSAIYFNAQPVLLNLVATVKEVK